MLFCTSVTSVCAHAGLKLQGGFDSGAQPVDRRLPMPQGDPQIYQSSGRATPPSRMAWFGSFYTNLKTMSLSQANVNLNDLQPNHLHLQVLPPLTDVKIRPEVGSTLRNKLVRLMTHVDMGVKQTAAEFLFVLCKESGEQMMAPGFSTRLAAPSVV